MKKKADYEIKVGSKSDPNIKGEKCFIGLCPAFSIVEAGRGNFEIAIEKDQKITPEKLVACFAQITEAKEVWGLSGTGWLYPTKKFLLSIKEKTETTETATSKSEQEIDTEAKAWAKKAEKDWLNDSKEVLKGITKKIILSGDHLETKNFDLYTHLHNYCETKKGIDLKNRLYTHTKKFIDTHLASILKRSDLVCRYNESVKLDQLARDLMWQYTLLEHAFFAHLAYPEQGFTRFLFPNHEGYQKKNLDAVMSFFKNPPKQINEQDVEIPVLKEKLLPVNLTITSLKGNKINEITHPSSRAVSVDAKSFTSPFISNAKEQQIAVCLAAIFGLQNDVVELDTKYYLAKQIILSQFVSTHHLPSSEEDPSEKNITSPYPFFDESDLVKTSLRALSTKAVVTKSIEVPKPIEVLKPIEIPKPEGRPNPCSKLSSLGTLGLLTATTFVSTATAAYLGGYKFGR